MCLAIPGLIQSVHDEAPDRRIGQVDFSGAVREVNLTLVPEAGVGDYVLIHAGVAISAIDEDEAREVLAALAEFEEPDPEPPAEA